MAQCTIILTFGSAVAIETNLSQGLNPLLLGVVLFCVNLSILILAIAMAFRRFRIRQVAAVKQLEQQAKKLELASFFSAVKFKTTFDAIKRNYVPPSSCLMFWYCTVAEAREALQSGIPVMRANFRHSEPGIVFTMLQPHEISSNESATFPDEIREAVLACSLPRHMLQRLPVPLSNSSLRILPGKVLSALRGSYFADLPNPRPWYEGNILLPPQCIVRAYQLLEDQSCSGPTEQISVVIDRDSINRRTRDVAIQLISSGAGLAKAMSRIRTECAEYGWTPLYHFTAPYFAPLILHRGLRMSTLGQVRISFFSPL